ncbi:type VI secretion system tube protein Hcp [Flavobacterium sp.]|uniref:type VI secretion system tube protein Hcp n=1 Tax=Flavobacterium sp. TaxID=239 RepID=UPI00286B61D3|nr:type VI secretion system tube protein Hcp [Flavobacterium sp.]
MKKINFKAIAFIAITSLTSQLFAQDATTKALGKTMASDDWQQAASTKATGQHIKEGIITCRVVATADGCSIVFENEIVSPRDAASGLPTGRRMHKPYSFVVSATDNSVTAVKSPRDAASGLATGRRMHKPVQPISTELDKASPKLIEKLVQGKTSSSSEIAIDEPGVHKESGSGMGSGKVSVSDLSIMSAGKATFKEFTITKRCDGKITKIVCPDGECNIPLGDCPDGSCSITADWSWGMTNQGTTTHGSGSGRCAVDFLLEIKDGACWDLAVQKK